MIELVYICSPGEGPEPKLLGAPFNFPMTPGVPIPFDDEYAKFLLDKHPNVKVYEKPKEAEPKAEDSPDDVPKEEAPEEATEAPKATKKKKGSSKK